MRERYIYRGYVVSGYAKTKPRHQTDAPVLRFCVFHIIRMQIQECRNAVHDFFFFQHSQNSLVFQIIHRGSFKCGLAIISLPGTLVDKHEENLAGVQIFNDVFCVNFAVNAYQVRTKTCNQELGVKRFLKMNDRIESAFDPQPIPASLHVCRFKLSAQNGRDQPFTVVFGWAQTEVYILRILHPGNMWEISKGEAQSKRRFLSSPSNGPPAPSLSVRFISRFARCLGAALLIPHS